MAVRLQSSVNLHPIEKSTNAARQGVTGHNVRYVLMISVGAAVLVLACTWLVFFFR